MDFAPYQASPPEHNRPFSPPTASNPASPRASLDNRRAFSPSQYGQPQYQYQYQQQQPQRGFASPPPLQHPQPQRSWQSSGLPGAYPSNYGPDSLEEGGIGVGVDGGGGGGAGIGGYYHHRDGVSEFATSLGVRLDYEAALAYLAFPPLGAILLLILERNSDYVRFHAWQSSLLFTAILVAHLILSGSPFLSWVLFFLDLALMVWLAARAYRDADTLDR